MQVGMLWFDNNRERDLLGKLDRAMEYYQSKYGMRPTLCYLHPAMLIGIKPEVDGLELRESNTVLPHHFWLGIEDEVTHRPAA
jgi:hypothetical protein